jgi:hypothetical protein
VHLASDYIHPYKDAGGRPSHCRVRIFLSDDVLDSPVVVCSELPNNPGGSITNSAETIAAEVIQANELSTPLVVFSSYKVEERAPSLGETRAWIADATWKTLDRASVAILVGGEV